MLENVAAVRFDRRASTGKTKPSLLACSTADHAEVEVIAKMSGGCERSIEALAIESISALLAADLGLPIPEPFLVKMSPAFIDSIVDEEIKTIAQASFPIAFGSKKLPPGFSAWPRDRKIPTGILQMAAEVFAFDALIQNSDRRPENPNCLVRGTDLAIFDHDLAFPGRLIIGWLPPWKGGSLQYLTNPNKHVFYSGLSGKKYDFSKLASTWQLISDERLKQYEKLLPPEWATSRAAKDALVFLRDLRLNISTSLAEVTRVLECTP